MLRDVRKLIADPRWKQRVFVMHSHRGDDSNLLALGLEREFVCEDSTEGTLADLSVWLEESRDWKFGFISYDLKNVIEELHSSHKNHPAFPLVRFVQPEVVLRFSNDEIEILKNHSPLDDSFFKKLLSSNTLGEAPARPLGKVFMEPRITRDQYVQAVNQLKQHIQRGDIYEVNFCQEFSSHEKLDDPYGTWLALNSFTNAPFSSYMQCGEQYLLCASPERFLQRKGEMLISQPIKGTIRRGKSVAEDEAFRQELYSSEKERSENVMIVDLVRNDLSRIATRGSVHVEELFGIHTFKTVHHMISTVSAQVRNDIQFGDILKALFPMGSMTGAPKVRAMQLIEQYEHSYRGLYSGTVGYMEPNGDFDFNVVIRSLIYNAALPYLTCSVGSAITALCDANSEYDECMLKADAILKALQHESA